MEEEERLDKLVPVEDGDRIGTRGGAADDSGASDTPPMAFPPKRSVRIAEAAYKSPSKTEQTSLRVNEARRSAKVKVKYFFSIFSFWTVTYLLIHVYS